MLRALSRPYTARSGAPTIDHVDPGIFTHRYFAACLACGYCQDACCAHGVDVDVEMAERILAQADALEALTGISRDGWFAPADTDADFPGGASVRTRVVDGACVFLNRRGRGCLLHAHAAGTGQDYHTIKPMVSTLFPLSFGEGALWLSDELEDGTLVCAGPGPSAYEAARSELAWYFGGDLVAELDRIGQESVSSASLASASPATRKTRHSVIAREPNDS